MPELSRIEVNFRGQPRKAGPILDACFAFFDAPIRAEHRPMGGVYMEFQNDEAVATFGSKVVPAGGNDMALTVSPRGASTDRWYAYLMAFTQTGVS